jgi:hypothetical protein
MVRKLDPDDFRAHRKILEPNDFALGSDEPDPPPTDLIDEDTWGGMMNLPDDVAIRTTSYQGRHIVLMYELWGDWLEVMPNDGILLEATLDAADDFSASLFNLTHGFYKQAIASLRNALEAMMIACDCEMGKASGRWRNWRDGKEVNFKDAREKFSRRPTIISRESVVIGKTEFSLVTDLVETPESRACKSWAQNLYGRLSNFSHSGGGSSNSSLWSSNGPVYSAEGMNISYRFYLETYAILVLLLSATSIGFVIPKSSRVLFSTESYVNYLEEPFVSVCKEYVGMFHVIK